MGSIDREALVRRHQVRNGALDPTRYLSVGNGELCMTVDATGLQTFPGLYPVADPGGGEPGTLLGTQAQWAWHSVPVAVEPELPRRPYATPRGDVPYVDSPALSGSDDGALPADVRWLRANPHRLDLVRMSLVLLDDGAAPRAPVPADVDDVDQVLDLWSGTVSSALTLAGRRLHVATACHPTADALAVRVTEPAVTEPAGDVAAGAVRATSARVTTAVRLAFPYGSEAWANAADWTRPGEHRTDVTVHDDVVEVARYFDGAADPTYHARLLLGAGTSAERSGDHEILLSSTSGAVEVVVALAPGAGGRQVGDPAGDPDRGDDTAAGDPDRGDPDRGDPGSRDFDDVDAVLAAAADHWPAFWRSGAALDLSGSTDPRAAELERRAVLSQYLTAIQSAGSLPPQETGLTCNSWRGRFHLEMHWWHAAHFPLWGRPELLERSMGWYRRVLPRARETARLQGYAGARWPKQVGPDGRESPSDIGPFLLWQQPHVIHLAELLRRAGVPDAAARYGDLVHESAEFMADIAEPTPDGFALGPPMVPAQESYAAMRERVTNPPFELAYWRWALLVAQEWRVRSGEAPRPRWDDVARGLVVPLVRAGRYEAIGVEPYTIRTDHPSMVYGLGTVPDTGYLDPAVVAATLDGVLADWDWESTWGWDYPALAMTAARIGDPGRAVEVLLTDTPKNCHLPNGHNRQTGHLPLYLPGNGGLLAALALMAGGWEGAAGDAPGFPDDWAVRHEGFVRAP